MPYCRKIGLLLLLCFVSLNLSQAQKKETYIVLARPSHLIRTAPTVSAEAISDQPVSIPYGGNIEVFDELVQADTLEGIPGHWRRVVNNKGKVGFMFDGYLVKKGTYLPASNAYSFERHERKIEGLDFLTAQNTEAIFRLKKQNRLLTTFLIIAFSLLLLGLPLLYYLFNRKLSTLSSGPSFQTKTGQLDLEAITQQITPKVSAALDPKIKKISPNLIELIQLQLKEFGKKMNREYEKKSHVKKILIEREDAEPTSNETEVVKETATTDANKLGFSDDTALFSAYLHKGFQRRFVELPRNNLFFGRKATPEITEHSVYELQVLEKDPSRALFRLIDEPHILEKALRFPGDYIFPVCEVYGNGNIQLAEQVEYSYGVAVKDGANWRIIQKAKLRYYLDEQLQEEEIAEQAWLPTGDDITKVLYAVAPKNDAFDLNQASETFEPGNHVYKITILEKDKAQFEIVENSKSQIKAFHLPNKYLVPAFATLGQGSIYVAQSAEIVQVGELVLENGIWKIVKKGIIQYHR